MGFCSIAKLDHVSHATLSAYVNRKPSNELYARTYAAVDRVGFPILSLRNGLKINQIYPFTFSFMLNSCH